MTGWQTLGCLGAVAVGIIAGIVIPGAGDLAGLLVTPVLVLLLFTTFATLPLPGAARAFGRPRFALTVLGLNFLVVPLVVAGIHLAVPLPGPVVVPVLIVLLTPCIDYVIAFTGLAGGAADRLLALTPVLMLAQILLLPVWLRVILGEDATAALTPGPFLWALVVFIIVPLLAAALLQVAAVRSAGAARVLTGATAAMTPLMLLTLAVVAAAEAAVVLPHLSDLGPAALSFIVFAVVMTGIGWLVGRASLPEAGERRALIFTGVTRNSLVMLPLVRAVDPDGLGTAAVVTQTLIELVTMVALVWLVPRIVPRTAMSENR